MTHLVFKKQDAITTVATSHRRMKKSQPFGSPKKRKVRISKEFPNVIPVQISEFLKNVFFKWSRDRFYKRSSSFGPRKNFDIYIEGRVKLLVFPLKKLYSD